MVKNEVFIPQSVILELTYRCNHACLFCFCPWEADVEGFPKYDKGTELTVDEWKRAIDILPERGVTTVSLSGGEALLKEGLLDILEHIRTKTPLNKDNKIALISNGLAMNEDYLAAFKQFNVHLTLSLPGLSTFKKHTGVDNANGVLHWLKRCREKGISTTLNVTVTKINYHELFETIAHGIIAGADMLLLNRFLIGGRGVKYRNELTLTADEINGMLDTAEEVLGYGNRNGATGTEIPMCIIKKKEHYKRLHIGYLCAAAKRFCAIDPAGFVRVCNHSPHKCGHIFDDEIISDKAYWNRFVNRDYIPSNCTQCCEVKVCDCGCREEANILYGSAKELDTLVKPIFKNEKVYKVNIK